MAKEQYHPTKMAPLVQIIARIVQRNPSIADNPDYLMATIGQNIPDFHKKERCINCQASMLEYIFEFGILNALLLDVMAKQVKENLLRGMDFTQANRVHIPTLGTTDGVRHMVTQTSKLALVAKHKVGKKHIQGMWVITGPGWAALRGEPTRKWVRVFRGEILERSEESITINQAFRSYSDKVAKFIATKKREPKQDHRQAFKDFNQSEWVKIAGIHEGEFI